MEKSKQLKSLARRWQSGFNIDKVKEAGLEFEDAETIKTPGIKQYPLTIECRVLYSQDQDPTPCLVPFALVPFGYPAENRDQQDRYDESRIHFV